MKYKRGTKEFVLNKYSGRCGYCGEICDKLEMDHIVSRNRGGSNKIENLMPACQPCNLTKMVFSIDEFRAYLKKVIEKAREYSSHFRHAERYGLITIKDDFDIVFYFEKVNL